MALPSKTDEGSAPVEHDLTSTGKKLFREAADAVPPTLCQLAEAAQATWNMDPPVIVLTCLHLMAAAVGRFHRLHDRAVRITCPFNVIFWSNERSRQRFAEHLGEPWFDHLRALAQESAQYTPAELRRFVGRVKKSISQPSSGHSDETPMERYTRLRPLTGPKLVVRSPLPKLICQALTSSYDRGVLSLDSGGDPVEELMRAGKYQISRLCSLLGSSWAGLDLPDGDRFEKPGVVHLLWQTHAEAVRSLVLDPRGPWHSAAPPVLLMWHAPQPAFLPDLPDEAMTRWSQMLIAFHANRHRLYGSDDWSLSPGAKQLWARFHDELTQLARSYQPFPSWMFAWIPELMLRIALVFSVLITLVPGEHMAVRVVHEGSVDNACAVTRWLAHEHYRCLRLLMGLEHPDNPNKKDAATGSTGGQHPSTGHGPAVA